MPFSDEKKKLKKARSLFRALTLCDWSKGRRGVTITIYFYYKTIIQFYYLSEYPRSLGVFPTAILSHLRVKSCNSMKDPHMQFAKQ